MKLFTNSYIPVFGFYIQQIAYFNHYLSLQYEIQQKQQSKKYISTYLLCNLMQHKRGQQIYYSSKQYLLLGQYHPLNCRSMAQYPSTNPYQTNPRSLDQPFLVDVPPNHIPLQAINRLQPLQLAANNNHNDSSYKVNQQEILVIQNPHPTFGQFQNQTIIIPQNNQHIIITEQQQPNAITIAQQNANIIRLKQQQQSNPTNINNSNINHDYQTPPLKNNFHQQIIITNQNQQQKQSCKRIPIRQSQPVRYYPGDTYIYPYYYDSSGCYYCCWFNGNCCPCQTLHHNAWSPICCDPFPCCNGCTGFHCGCLDFIPCCQMLQCVKNNNCECCQFLPCYSGCEFCSNNCDGACISALPCCNDCQCGQICQIIPCCNGCECNHIFGCLPCCNNEICNICECLQGCDLCNYIDCCKICECLGNCQCGNIDCNGCDCNGCDCNGCDGCDLGVLCDLGSCLCNC